MAYTLYRKLSTFIGYDQTFIANRNHNLSTFDLTFSTDKFVFKNGGNFGIGTASPSELLHVVGNGLFTGTLTSTSHTINTGDLLIDNNRNIRYKDSGGSYRDNVYVNGSNVLTLQNNALASGGALQFFSGASATNAGIYINTSNNVGVGTTSPTARLHVLGSGTSSGTYAAKFQDSLSADIFTIRDDGQVKVTVSNNGIAGFWVSHTGNDAALQINHTNAAGYGLFISATSTTNAINVSSGRTYLNGAAGIFTVANDNYGLNVYAPTVSAASRGINIQNTNTSAFQHIGLNVNLSGASSTTKSGIEVAVTGGSTNYAILTTGGNSGFGTATPNASAIVEMSSTSQGFLPPVMTGAQGEAISTPATGLMIYATSAGAGDITAAGIWVYNGANWVTLN